MNNSVVNNFISGNIEIQDYFNFGGHTYRIYEWAIINITEQVANNMIEDESSIILANRENLMCSELNSRSRNCNKAAVFCKEVKEDNKFVGLCKAHFQKTRYDTLPIVDKKKGFCYWKDSNNELKCCNAKSMFALKSNYYITYCTKHKNELIKGDNLHESNKINTSSYNKDSFLKLKM